MARATGVSQPHLHNILKGIRALPPELADQLLDVGGFHLPDLMGLGGPQASPGPAAIGPRECAREAKPLHTKGEPEDGGFAAFPMRGDPAMEPRFQRGDVVYYRLDARARSELSPRCAYLVHHHEQLLVRYVRMGGRRLYLVSEKTLNDPVRWDYVSLAGRHILEIVRGRIVWICRKVEGPEASAAEEARRDDRRVG